MSDEKVKEFVKLGEFRPADSDHIYPICIPCWTQEEIELAEKEAEKFMRLFEGED